MNLAQMQQASNGLRSTHHPRAWFDDPNGVTNCFHDWYTWSIGSDPLPTGASGPPYAGLRDAVISLDKRLGMGLFLDTTAGANKVWEYVRRYQIMPVPDSAVSDWSVFEGPMFFSMRMNRSNPAGSDTGEKYQGISLGDPFQIPTPWQTGYASAPIQEGRIGLHWNYTSSKWQLMLHHWHDDPVVPPELIDCTIQPPFTVDQDPAEVALLWVPPLQFPSEFGSIPRHSRIVAMINGITCLDLKDHDRANSIGASQSGPGIYFTHGSNAGSRASEAGFYTGRFWQPLPL